MKKFGLVLIILEIVAIVFGIASGDSPLLDLVQSNEAGASLIAKALGYLLPGIIGIILYRKGKKKEEDAAGSASGPSTGATSTKPSSAQTSSAPTSSAHTSTTSAGTPAAPAGRFCPKCGTKADADDAYCVNCGTKLK